MFLARPDIIDTEVFFSLPDHFRKPIQTSWSQVNNGGAATDCFLEGPAFDRNGNLFVTDIPHGRIFRIDPQGYSSLVAEYDGEPIGLKVHKDGRLWVADYRLGLLTVDPADGSVTPLVSRRDTETFKGINDLTFTQDGDVFFTDQGQTGLHDPTGRVYRYDRHGRLGVVLSNLPAPNGIVLNRARTLLFVAATRDNAVWRALITPDGSVTKLGVFVQLSGGAGPDGMAMDVNGNLLVVHAGFGGAWLFSPKGEPLHFIRSCRGDLVTNAAYGGPDSHFIYITESSTGSVLRARMPVPGEALFSHL